MAGGYAVAAHGRPRYFGFASLGLTVEDFVEPGRVVQLGHPPLRIDLLTSVDGVSFADCWEHRFEVLVDDPPVPFIGLDDLRRNRAASGRPQDAADVAALEGG